MASIANLVNDHPTYSYEFFPPKDEAQALDLAATVADLSPTDPDFVSVTCGALGGSQALTRDVVVGLNSAMPFPAMPHLTCVGQTRTEIAQTLDLYQASGIENILALRGDGENTGDFAHAIDLVTAIKEASPETSVGVAAHPEVHPSSPNRQDDRCHLAAKLEIADFAITQFFFEADHYRRLVDELGRIGCSKPVIPGVMLFTSAAGLQRMSLLNNTSVPSALRERLGELTDPADVGKLAVETAANLIDELDAEGVPGVHIYTLNRSAPALELHKLVRGY